MDQRPSAVIIADGGVDLPAGFAAQYDIRLLPLMVFFGSEQLRSGEDITPEQFYARLRTGGVHPTTSQPSVGDYVELFKEAAQTGLPILSLHLSAGLSGSMASARTAREMLPDLDIRLIDTGTLSGAMALQVMAAAGQAKRGVAPDEIVQTVRSIGERSNLLFTLDTLEYLRRGGRIGRVAGYVGTLLGIRPIITVDKSTGTYVATDRARSFRQAITRVADRVVHDVGEGGPVSCVVLYGDCEGEARGLIDTLKNRVDLRMVELVHPNPALGVHTGPAAVGIGYYPGVLPI